MTFVHRTLDFLLLLLTLFFPSSYYSYLKEFGFTIPDRPIMVDDIRVRGCGQSGITSVYKAEMGHRQAKPATVNGVTYRVPHISLIRRRQSHQGLKEKRSNLGRCMVTGSSCDHV